MTAPVGGVVLTLLLIAGLASAAGPECIECCKQAGLVGCPTRVRAHGPDSHLSKEGGAWRVSGLWWLDCDSGATYDDGATVVLAQRPMAGQVLRMATPTAAITCFANTCALPQGGCMRAAGNTGEVVLVRCSDNKMLTESEMMNSGTAPAPPPPAGLDLTLPPPATRCADGQGLMDAAQAQVGAAQSKLQAGEVAGAANSFRAALTIDPCNADGWAGLGNVALSSGDHGTAISALEAATRLKPKDPDNWVRLAQAHRAAGATDDALDAIDQALECAPEHAEAKAMRQTLAPTP